MTNSIVGSRGTRPLPPPARNVFIFMQFSGKIDQIIGWYPFGVDAPLREILDPPFNSGEFRIFKDGKPNWAETTYYLANFQHKVCDKKFVSFNYVNSPLIESHNK